MPNFIVSTCGTSIFSGSAPDHVRQLLTTHANAKSAEEVAPEVLAPLRAHVQHRTEELAQANDLKTLTDRSAELAGLIAFYGGTLGGKDHHVLLSTDTWLGEQAAQTIQTLLQHYGQSTEVKRIPDLRTDDLSAYRTALSALVDWAYTELPAYKKAGYRIIFNLTGGFKSVQGFMQTLGALHADECVYVFERSGELIRLPRLPIKMQAESYVRDNLVPFRRMAHDLPVAANQVRAIPELLLFSVDDQVVLSEWGDLVWREVKGSIYSEEKAHLSPSDKLTWSEGFERSLSGLEGRRWREINAKIDELARYLETGKLLMSLDFKPIRGGTRQGSTHEMDAWHDGDARRLYGHYDGAIFVLDRLDAALH